MREGDRKIATKLTELGGIMTQLWPKKKTNPYTEVPFFRLVGDASLGD